MNARPARVAVPMSTPEDVASAAALVGKHLRRVLVADRCRDAKLILKPLDRSRILAAFKVMESLQGSEGEARP